MTDVYKQVEFLTEEVAKVIEEQSKMIDPVQFGELRGAVGALKSEVDQLKTQQARMDEKLDIVLTKLSEAKGGWKLLMALGGAAATLGGVITWFATHTITVGPKG
jgi:FtsZ-binding cell division protein ZapB